MSGNEASIDATEEQRWAAQLLTGDIVSSFGGSTEDRLIDLAMHSIEILDEVDPSVEIGERSAPPEVTFLDQVVDQIPPGVINKAIS